ncbi:MAG: crotonase/enoyl-CoA hydratase family protein [Dehalococcoidia bacterium]|nr:MAG: crotonase/enoyl-CoA hydratase family protein [Dehalococcoidia bacterium]
MPKFEALTVSSENRIANIQLNRPDKANAINATMWKELKGVFDWVNGTPEVRVAVLSGQGKHFSAGIDFEFLSAIYNEVSELSEGRRQERLRQIIIGLQDSVTAIERCRKPVIAAIHGACIGGGIDLITACDIRYATVDARFSIKEVDLAIVADTGTLQRLPRLIGDGLFRELAYTGLEFDGVKAHSMGLVNKVFADQPSLLVGVRELANEIAAKSPLAIRGIKETLIYSRDHTVAEGLNYVATWNTAIGLSKDVQEAVTAYFQNRCAEFED